MEDKIDITPLHAACMYIAKSHMAKMHGHTMINTRNMQLLLRVYIRLLW